MDIIILILAFSTLAILVAGLITMGRNKGEDSKHKPGHLSNKLMVARVGFQAVTIFALILMVFVFGNK